MCTRKNLKHFFSLFVLCSQTNGQTKPLVESLVRDKKHVVWNTYLPTKERVVKLAESVKFGCPGIKMSGWGRGVGVRCRRIGVEFTVYSGFGMSGCHCYYWCVGVNATPKVTTLRTPCIPCTKHSMHSMHSMHTMLHARHAHLAHHAQDAHNAHRAFFTYKFIGDG